jgi:hypothetical protein
MPLSDQSLAVHIFCTTYFGLMGRGGAVPDCGQFHPEIDGFLLALGVVIF